VKFKITRLSAEEEYNIASSVALNDVAGLAYAPFAQGSKLWRS